MKLCGGAPAPEDAVSPSLQLPALPLEILEAICSHFSLQDRLHLVGCCAALHRRGDVAGSAALWGDGLGTVRPRHLAPSLVRWLQRHRAALRRLQLEEAPLPALAELLAALEGAQLTELTLANSPAVSSAPEATLSPLASLSRLEGLALPQNRLRELPRPLVGLTQLRRLSLAGNIVLWQGGEAGFEPLRALHSLRSLDVSSCRLKRLPPQLADLPQLEELDVSFNAWGQGGEAALRVLGRCTTLTRLDLHSCGLVALPAALSALSRLADLNLNGNTPIGHGLETAFAPLASLTALTRLSLVGCWLRALPPQLPRLTHLADLRLGGNEPLGQGPESSVQLLGALGRSLVRLDLSFCGMVALPPELSKLEALEELDLRGQPRLGGALGPLLALPALRRLGVRGSSQGGEATLRALAERGVVVQEA